MLHTVYRQRQALQTTSVAYCKFRRYDEILILQIKLVGLVWIVGWDWVGSHASDTTYGLLVCSVGLVIRGVEDETTGRRDMEEER